MVFVVQHNVECLFYGLDSSAMRPGPRKSFLAISNNAESRIENDIDKVRLPKCVGVRTKLLVTRESTSLYLNRHNLWKIATKELLCPNKPSSVPRWQRRWRRIVESCLDYIVCFCYLGTHTGHMTRKLATQFDSTSPRAAPLGHRNTVQVHVPFRLISFRA